MANKLCEDCANWKLFKEKCWFYWDRKKVCTNHRKTESADPGFKQVEFLE